MLTIDFRKIMDLRKLHIKDAIRKFATIFIVLTLGWDWSICNESFLGDLGQSGRTITLKFSNAVNFYSLFTIYCYIVIGKLEENKRKYLLSQQHCTAEVHNSSKHLGKLMETRKEINIRSLPLACCTLTSEEVLLIQELLTILTTHATYMRAFRDKKKTPFN